MRITWLTSRNMAWTVAAWSLLSIAVAFGWADAWDVPLHGALRVGAGTAGLWQAITFLGDAPMRAGMAVVGVATLWQVHRSRAFLLAATAVVAQTLSTGLKLAFARPRPDGLIETATFAYPSGHAFVTTAILVAWARLAGDRRTVVLAVVLGGLVGASRLALGVHYVSDVVSGWLLAALLTTVRLRSTNRPGPDGDGPAGGRTSPRGPAPP